jgi:hypothetical protein
MRDDVARGATKDGRRRTDDEGDVQFAEEGNLMGLGVVEYVEEAR